MVKRKGNKQIIKRQVEQLEEMVDALFKVGTLGYGDGIYGVLKTLAYEIDQLKRKISDIEKELKKLNA